MLLSASLIFTVCLASLVSSAPDPKVDLESQSNGIRGAFFRPERHQESRRPKESEIEIGHQKIPYRILRLLTDELNAGRQGILIHPSDVASILSSSSDLLKLVMDEIGSKYDVDGNLKQNYRPDIEVFANDRELRLGDLGNQDDGDDEEGPDLLKRIREHVRPLRLVGLDHQDDGEDKDRPDLFKKIKEHIKPLKLEGLDDGEDKERPDLFKKIRVLRPLRPLPKLKKPIKIQPHLRICQIIEEVRKLRRPIGHLPVRDELFKRICKDGLIEEEGADDAGGYIEEQKKETVKEIEEEPQTDDSSKESASEVDGGEGSAPGELLYDKP